MYIEYLWLIFVFSTLSLDYVSLWLNDHLFGFSTQKLIFLLLVLFIDFFRELWDQSWGQNWENERISFNSTFPSHSGWPFSIPLSVAGSDLKELSWIFWSWDCSLREELSFHHARWESYLFTDWHQCSVCPF